METRRLGGSGLALSQVTLGTLTWGRDTDPHEAVDLLRIYLDRGGRSIDVPSDYMSTTFEGRCSVVGQTVKTFISREEMVIIGHSGVMPQFGSRMETRHPLRMGPQVSRRNLLCSLDHMLDSVGTDFVDVWVIHGPRQGVSSFEVVGAAQFAVQCGKAAYIVFADFDSWDMGCLFAMAQANNVPVAGLAGQLSLLAAKDLSNKIPHAIEQGLGYIAFAPLAHGVLSGKYKNSTPPDSRAATAHLGAVVKPFLTSETNRVVEAVMRTANGLDDSPVRVSLAWTLAQLGVATAVTGPRTARQLETLFEKGSFRLQRELRDVLTEIALY